MAPAQLFKKRTLLAAARLVTPTPEQIAFASEWGELIRSGTLAKERRNYFRFGNLVLQGILGYSVSRDLNFEEGNVEFSFRRKDGTGGVCFEAKGESTRDLFASQHREKTEHRTPVKQTWDYMGSGNFEYGVTTNYREFVLITKALGYTTCHRFDFEEIRADPLKLGEFIAVFSAETLLNSDLPTRLRKESELEEIAITSGFYRLFSETRIQLVHSFESVPNTSREVAIHVAQLVLNRLVFVFFASGTGKVRRRAFTELMLRSLHPDLVSDYSHYAFDTILSLFKSLDKGATAPFNIFGFNGGLFREHISPDLAFPDLLIDKPIPDGGSRRRPGLPQLDPESQRALSPLGERLNPIIRNLLLMADFDFQSDLDVNILGHIFEQSLTDLEALAGTSEDSRRRKEGIYYTPSYVTAYICKETVIRVLSDGKTTDADELLSIYSGDIASLERRLRDIRILDPACGSGAFLLEAVDLLLDIHRIVRLAKETEGRFLIGSTAGNQSSAPQYWSLERWSEEDEAREIIEDCIFGVDKNPESVEITRLSLFLKVATINRKLFDLSRNIRVGNSLVSDQAVAGARAFDWKTEFPEIAERGGFDVILGNPPYVRVQRLDHAEADYLHRTFKKSVGGKFDLSVPFFERALELIRPEGWVGFISSSQWMNTDYGRRLRTYLSEGHLHRLVSFGSLPVFADVSTYPAIFILRRATTKALAYSELTSRAELTLTGIEAASQRPIPIDQLGSASWALSGGNLLTAGPGARSRGQPLGGLGKFWIGALTGADYAFVVTRAVAIKLRLEPRFLVPYAYRGEEIWPYGEVSPGSYLIYPYTQGQDGRPELVSEVELLSKAPNIHAHLNSHRSDLETRLDSRRRYAAGDQWFRFLRPGTFRYIIGAKLVVRGISKHSVVGSLPAGTSFNGANTPAFVPSTPGVSLPIVAAILNSTVVSRHLESICPRKLGGYFRFNANSLNRLPIPPISPETQTSLGQLAARRMDLAREVGLVRSHLLHRLQEISETVSDPRLVEAIDLGDVKAFTAGLKRLAPGLGLRDLDEWEGYFGQFRVEQSKAQAETSSVDGEIDAAVQAIFGV